MESQMITKKLFTNMAPPLVGMVAFLGIVGGGEGSYLYHTSPSRSLSVFLGLLKALVSRSINSIGRAHRFLPPSYALSTGLMGYGSSISYTS